MHRDTDTAEVTDLVSKLDDISIRVAVRPTTGERFYLYRLVRPVPTDDGKSHCEGRHDRAE